MIKIADVCKIGLLLSLSAAAETPETPAPIVERLLEHVKLRKLPRNDEGAYTVKDELHTETWFIGPHTRVAGIDLSNRAFMVKIASTNDNPKFAKSDVQLLLKMFVVAVNKGLYEQPQAGNALTEDEFDTISKGVLRAFNDSANGPASRQIIATEWIPGDRYKFRVELVRVPVQTLCVIAEWIDPKSDEATEAKAKIK